MANTTEETIWEGSQSQVLNFGVFAASLVVIIIIAIVSFILFPLLIVLAALPVIYAFYKLLIIRSNKYKITNERIFYTTGILSKKTEALELYRVKDMDVLEPFTLRMFKLGNIEIDSADESTPKFHLKAIPAPQDLMNKIRTSVEKRRDIKGVRGLDLQADHGVDGN